MTKEKSKKEPKVTRKQAAKALCGFALSKRDKILLGRMVDQACEMARVCGDELEGYVPEGADPHKAAVDLWKKLVGLDLIVSDDCES